MPATAPPATASALVPITGTGARLGPWKLTSGFLVLAALADQGLATVTRPGGKTMIVFRGGLSIPPDLRRQGWVHVGDPGSWHGYLFDAYQAALPAQGKLFVVTTPQGAVHELYHPLTRGEAGNNSFAAVSPDGKWLVSGEWNTMRRLLVFPTPIVNPTVPAGRATLALSAIISLDHPVRDVQGCTFVTPIELLCASDDPDHDLWPTPRQLLRVMLPRPLDGRHTTARVTSLGELPTPAGCSGTTEVEGIDFQPDHGPLRVEVRPPGTCGLATVVYDYEHTGKS